MSTAEIEVPGVAHVRGRITAVEDGAPVAGVVVRVQERGRGTGARVVTDADGRYDFAAPGTGTWEFPDLLAPPGWALVRTTARCWDAMLPGDERVEDAQLCRAGSVIGSVPDAADGSPAAVVGIHLDTARNPFQHRRRIALADGRFRFDDLAPGRVALFAATLREDWLSTVFGHVDDAIEADPAALDRASFDVRSGHVVEAVLDLVPGTPSVQEESPATAPDRLRKYRVSARVRTADGLPLRSAWSHMTSDAPRRAGPGSGTSSCPPGGESAEPWPIWIPAFGRPLPWDGLATQVRSASPGDRIFVVAADERHPVARSWCVAPEDVDAVELDVVLPAAAVVRGRVVAGDVPVAGARIFADGGECARTRNDGTFDVTCTRRTCWLRVEAPGFVAAEKDVDLESSPDLLSIELAPARTLTGRVVDPDGRPWAGVRVRPLDDEVRDYDGVTDADGRFALRGLPLTRVRLLAVSPKWAATRVAPVVIESDRDERDTTIVVTTGLTIEGQAFRRDGRPHSDDRVSCEPLDTDAAHPPNSQEVFTDADGHFRVTGLHEGEYLLANSPLRVRAGARGVRVVIE